MHEHCFVFLIVIFLDFIFFLNVFVWLRQVFISACGIFSWACELLVAACGI